MKEGGRACRRSCVGGEAASLLSHRAASALGNKLVNTLVIKKLGFREARQKRWRRGTYPPACDMAMPSQLPSRPSHVVPPPCPHPRCPSETHRLRRRHVGRCSAKHAARETRSRANMQRGGIQPVLIPNNELSPPDRSGNAGGDLPRVAATCPPQFRSAGHGGSALAGQLSDFRRESTETL